MTRFRALLPFLFFFLLPLLLFWPILWGNATLIPFDNLYQGQPWATYRAELGVQTPHNELVSDLVLQNFQWKKFAVSQYQQGELPLWQPHQLAGSPFLAAGQHSMLYPLSLLFLLLPIHVAFGWFTVFSLALAGMSMYGFARVLGLRLPAATLAGLTYQGSGFLAISVVFPMVIAGAVWLPLLLAAIHRLAQVAKGQDGSTRASQTSDFLPWMAVGAIAIGLAALAGHVEILYYTLLVGGFYALAHLFWLLIRSRRARNLEQQAKEYANVTQIPAPRVFSFVSWGLTMLLVGLLLGSAQIMPLYEMVSQNYREGSASLQEVRGYAWPIRQASSFLLPDLLGNPSRHTFYNLQTGRWEPIVTQQPIDDQGNTVSIDHVAWFKGTSDWKNYVEGAGYIGILPLVLALLALLLGFRRPSSFSSHRSALFFFTLLSVLSLLFIFGTPLYALLFYGLPGWSQLHTPFRWVFPLTLSLSVLAGIGWQVLKPMARVHDKKSTNSTKNRLVKSFAWLAVISGGLGLLALLTMRVAPEPWIGQAAKLLDRSQLTQWAFGGSAALFLSYQWSNFIHFGWALLGTGLVLLLALRPTHHQSTVNIAFILAIVLLVLDLSAASTGFMPVIPQQVAEFTPPSLQWLSERHELGKWRYTALEKDWKIVNANAAMQYGLEDIRGYDSIILKHYVQFMQAVGPQEQLDFNRIAPIYAEPERQTDQELLDLLNVRYLVTDQLLDWRGWSLAYDDEVRIYQNEDVLPRAFMLGNGVYWGLRQQEIPTETLQELNPQEMVYLQGEEGDIVQRDVLQSDMPFTPVQITSYTPNEIIMTVAPPQNTWLVFSEVDYPGWRAFSDIEWSENEIELPIMRANGAFRAVWLNAGKQTIRWRYSPNSVKTGFFASFLGVAALGLAAAYWGWGKIYQEQENEGTVRRVAKNSFAPMILQLFNKAIDTVFAAFMARLLGPESLGQYAFAIALIWYFIIFSNFGLGTLLTRDVARDRTATNSLFNTTLLLRLVLYLLSFPILLLLLWLWPQIDAYRGLQSPTLEPTTILAIMLLAVGLIPSNLSDAVTAVFRAYEKFEIPALVATIATFIKVSVGAGVLIAGYGIVGLAATSIVTNVATFIILSLLMVQMIYRPTLQLSDLSWRSMLHDAFPLMINEFLATAFFRIDQVMLKPMRGNAEAGFYNVSYKFIDGLLILPSSFTLAIFPVMSRYAQQEAAETAHQDKLSRPSGSPRLLRATSLSLRWLIMLALPMALLTTRYADAIVWAFGGPEFLPESGFALKILIWFLPFSFINSLLQYVLIAANRQHSLTRAYLIGLLFNVIANFFAIRYFGLYGAAGVTILSEIMLLLPFYKLIRESVGHLSWPILFSKPLIALLFAALPLWAYPFPFWSAIPFSCLLYGLSLLLLRFFTQEDQQILAKLLPNRLTNRFRLNKI